MSLLGTIVIGAIIGWIASLIGKTNDQMGFLWNIVVGIVGAALGHWIATHLFEGVTFNRFSLTGMLISLAGALLLVLLLRGIGILRRDKK